MIGITDIIANKHPELKNSEHRNSLKFSAKYLLSLVKEREIKILLVEDNKINQVVTEKLLNSFNFKTVVVADGFKAVR